MKESLSFFCYQVNLSVCLKVSVLFCDNSKLVAEFLKEHSRNCKLCEVLVQGTQKIELNTKNIRVDYSIPHFRKLRHIVWICVAWRF